MQVQSQESVDVLAVGREVIAQEIAGLTTLSDALDAQFVAAVESIAALKGRLIVTGMGKSGHVARKIAATMASTGTPAQYVHPAEASHGDLGMITPDDAVLALSNSGETQELSDIIAYCRRFAIPLIGIVRRAQSMLVEAASIAIILPDIAEASPVNAPTTSTTMMLAYGDAMAVALLELRGFNKEAFGVFHPGGKLGQAFLRVEQLMHVNLADAQELPLVQRTTPMQEVLLEITTKHFGCAGVVDDAGRLVGAITDGDLRRHMADGLLMQRAEEIMTEQPKVVAPNTLAAEALAIMNTQSITCLFVVEDEKPIGILHVHDLLRAGVM